MTFNTSYLPELDAHDLELYLYGSYIKTLIPDSPQFEYARCDKVIGHGKSSVFRLTNSKGNIEFPFRELEFDFSFPKSGYYNLERECFLYRQNPMRQYKKGLCSDNHSIYHMLSKILSKYTFSWCKWIPNYNLDVWKSGYLNSLFLTQDSRSIRTRIAKILKGQQVSIALNRDFAISQGIISKNPTIWFRDRIIGELKHPETVEIKNEIFMQEAIDFFSPEEISVII